MNTLNIAKTVENFGERGKRCFCYTSDTSPENISAIRDRGCLLALISLDRNTFKRSIECHPDMCEFLHTSDFNAIEDDYFNSLKLY